MPNIKKKKSNLISRTRKIVGQFQLVLHALEQNLDCTEVLHRLSAARSWANTLMADLLEDHILSRVALNPRPPGETADDIFEIVRTYLR